MTEMTKLTDDDLLRQMLEGDEQAFAALYQRRQGGVYRFALQMTGKAEIAEEVTQEVFMTLIREPKQFDPAKGTLKAFLYGIGRNYALRLLERERPYVSLTEKASYGDDCDVLA